MRIAIFSETYLPDTNGVATHVKILAEGLKMLGHQVLIVTADASSRKHYIEKDVLRCPAITAKKIYNYSLSSPLSIKRLKILKQFKPDIIHIHNEFGIGLSGTFISKILKIPYVYTLHTMYDDYIHYIAKKPFVPLVTDASHIYFKLLAKKATAITGPSKKVNEFLKSCGMNKPVFVINNSAELDIFSKDKINYEHCKEIREKYGFSQDDFIGVFCGRLGKEKSIDTLLKYYKEQVNENDKIKLLIIGGGPEKDNLVALNKQYELENIVAFTDKIPHCELPDFYASCNFYITTSKSEMHSISMIEAMASGLPVLYIKDEFNMDQIENGINGYIFSDSDQMIKHINYLRNLSSIEYDDFCNKVRESVKTSGAEGIANILINIYNNCIKEYNKKG